MATAEEILATMDEVYEQSVLEIDSDLRKIKIPGEVKILGVENDDDVMRLHFSMPRMYGEFDLSTFTVQINYLNANNKGDVYPVTDAKAEGDRITFSWLVGKFAAKYKGDVKFIVCLKRMEDGEKKQEFNTTLAVLPVLEGLETSKEVEEEHPDVLESILVRLDELEKGGTGGAGVGVDKTLTQSGMAADAKTTGDAIRHDRTQIGMVAEKVYAAPYIPTLSISLDKGGLSTVNGVHNPNDNTAYCRSDYIRGAKEDMLMMFGLPGYEWVCWSYKSKSVSSASHMSTDGWQSADTPVQIKHVDGDVYFRVAFRSKDGADITQEYDNILAALKFYTSQEEHPAYIETERGSHNTRPCLVVTIHNWDEAAGAYLSTVNYVYDGVNGNDGRGIVSITPDTEAGTITIEYTDGLTQVIKLGSGGSGASIDDTAPSAHTTYSGQKIESIATQLKEEIDDLLPDVASADAGKFLRVSSDGAWVAESIASAEGANF